MDGRDKPDHDNPGYQVKDSQHWSGGFELCIGHTDGIFRLQPFGDRRMSPLRVCSRSFPRGRGAGALSCQPMFQYGGFNSARSQAMLGVPERRGVPAALQAQQREGDPQMLARICSSRLFLLILLSAMLSLPTSAQISLCDSEAIAAAMKRLSIQLPSAATDRYALCKPLEDLNRERCDQQAILDLGKALEHEGYRREAATAHVSFSDSCGGHAPSLRAAANFLLKLSDYTGAARIASRLIELEPFNDNGYYLRALANDRGAMPYKAIDDYLTAIELFGDKSKIADVSYYGLARSYEKLGQFCDAALSIDAWVALNPGQHDTSQTRAMISSYTAKGGCASRMPSAREEVFPITRRNNVVTLPVMINGTRGTLILDTGATYVALKSAFAQKAKVEIEQDSSLLLNTANGLAEGKRGRAKLIQLRSLQAKDVPIVVQTEKRGMFGDDVDGLLGMSFLSRFHVTIGSNSVKLSPRTAQ
jgi:clan AA aspartic protease (TIGR02281 family)